MLSPASITASEQERLANASNDEPANVAVEPVAAAPLVSPRGARGSERPSHSEGFDR